MNDYTWFERGHVAIVTGASKGLGRAIAGELARAGISLVIDARGADALAHAERELSQLVPVVAIAGDVADGAHVHALVDAAERRFGRIDLVVNNASTIGRSPLPALDQLSPSTFDRIFTTNVFAPLHLIQHALPVMRRNGGGTIVNISSDAAVEPYAGWGGYGSAKAALEHMSRILAAELDGSGIGVIVADPGDMDTELHRAAVPDADAVPARRSARRRARAAARDRSAARRVRARRAAVRRSDGERVTAAVSFTLPPANEATTTPERRGLARDGVRLLVTDVAKRTQHDAVFRELPWFLRRGDLLVVNDSATLAAALVARRADGTPFPLHLSTQIGGELWIAEPRAAVSAGERATLAGGGSATFLSPVDPSHLRLWYVMLSIPAPLDAFLARHGTPIRYRYVHETLPIGNYQTIFARIPGSAEMPSAGRPFSQRSIDELRRAGVAVAAITLHTGVSSPERHERPYREWFDVSAQTAAAVNAARHAAGA